jgi:putative Mg2+ transporter-C (MgtC) family protein
MMRALLAGLVGQEGVEVMLRVLAAAVLGAGMGWERERHGRPAGVRTHMLLCLGCALIMVVSFHVAARASTGELGEAVRADPGRIAGHALSGLGFLGAGAIVVLGPRVRGLTTAASIWVTAAVGLALGAGCMVPAVFAWLLAMVGLLALGRLEATIRRKDAYVHLALACSGTDRRMPLIRSLLEGRGFKVLDCLVRREAERVTYRLALRYNRSADFEEVTSELAAALTDCGVEEIEWSDRAPS